MSNIKLRFCLLLVVSLLVQTPCFVFGEGVVINEFQASNILGISDEDGDKSDWIELLNTSAEKISLSGWSLTDNNSEPRKWFFPDVSIEAGEYMIIFASEKDKRVVGKELHTNFKLSDSGEFLGLYSPDGFTVTELRPFPAQKADYSYGLLDGFWVSFKTSSPGLPNTANSVAQFPAPIFSQEHGFYDKSFILNISCTIDNANIYYTTDGSVPSVNNGTLYSGGITVAKTTVLRAIAVSKPSIVDPLEESTITTRTYLFVDNIVRQSNSPPGYPKAWGKYAQISGTSIADYEMDPELMAEAWYVEKVKTALKELPVISLVTDKNNLFSNVNNELTGGIYIFTGTPVGDGTGLGWERPVSFEYFFAKDAVSLQFDCGLQLHGGHSRLPEKSPKHSFRLDFKTEYGPSKLYYPLFGKSESSEINAFFLRAGFGNTWIHHSEEERGKAIYTRDTWTKQTQRKMGHLTTNTQYAHLFINGLYWGLYNPTERVDEDFCVTYLGGNKDDYDIIKVDDGAQNIYASNGNTDAWYKLISLVANASDQAVYQRIQGNNPDGTPNATYECLLDVDNLIDYMLINFYGGNTDWDHHNWIALRNRVNPGKGFMFLCWDSEQMLKTADEKILAEKNNYCPSYIFQQLRNNKMFCRLFGDHVQKHCFNNGCLSPSAAADTWLALASIIDNSLYAESARWGDYRKDVHPYATAGKLYRKDVHYDANKKNMLENYFPNRTDIFIKQLKSANLFPSTEAPVFKINGQTVKNDTVNDGAMLSLSVASGNIYYTVDGTDPVVWSQNGSGTKSASAKDYSGAWELDENVNVKTRAFYGSIWSALNERSFFVQKIAGGLKNRYDLWKEITVQNFPNPFRGQTTFNYSIPLGANVRIDIYDLSGRNVANILDDYQEAGSHSIVYDGSGLIRGIYICRFVVKGSVDHQKGSQNNKNMIRACFFETLPEKVVRCLLCPHMCLLHEGAHGICRTRVNRDGTLFNMAYGNPCSVSVDPIEKKPLFHFFPGSEIYSVATAGCNFRCLNCQNWEISQASPMDLRQYEMEPEKLVQKALLNHTDSIAFTYTEPTVFYEFMLDTAKLAQEKGLKNVMISNGYINEKPLLELCQYLDAANIDLKCFDDVIYHRLTGGHLQPVLDSLKVLKKQGVWLEITNLLIPDISDGTAMIETMCGWLVDNGFSETPLHFSRFFPTYKLQQTLPTSGQSLLKAKEIAEKSGMQYVYIGNLPGLHGENTFCPNCKNILVDRNGYVVSKNSIENCLCSFCGEPIAGVWQ